MLLAKIKEKLFNRKNKVEIEDVEVKGDIPASIKALIESLGGTSIKIGDYIFNEETNKFEWVEEIPEDYTGYNLYIDQETIGLYHYVNGEIDYEVYLDLYSGVSKLNFTSLTHSFNELDPTLKQIVDDAVADADADGVACTQEQWKAIKSLLDKSLYLHYNGYSMIKSSTDGINLYVFGVSGAITGCTLDLFYDNDHLLYAKCVEV